MSEAALTDYLLSLLTDRRRGRFEDVLSQRTRRVAVVLENVSQSHNFSAVIRSCDCFGVQDVYVVDRDGIFQVNREVTMGSHKWLTVNHFVGEGALAECVSSLKARGYRVLITSPHGESEPVSEVTVETPLALVFGTELDGVTEEAERLADGRVHVPMHGFTESLNVSVAVAVMLADLSRRLRKTDNWQLSNPEQAELRLEWARRSITAVEGVEARWHRSQPATSSR